MIVKCIKMMSSGRIKILKYKLVLNNFDVLLMAVSLGLYFLDITSSMS